MFERDDYTIPETIRGLQRSIPPAPEWHHYTIPETIRGLQRRKWREARRTHYTIPETIMGLQLIIYRIYQESNCLVSCQVLIR